jgi:hypothetical protein
MLPTSELLVLSAAVLGVALSSGVLLSCKKDEATAETAPAGIASAASMDPNDPEALRRAAAVVATWNQKDPALTAKVLADNGIVITDPATFQAMADALSRSQAAASASALAATAPRPKESVTRKPPPSPMA